MISIIIYARDREFDVKDTYFEVLKACEISQVKNYEIILVDDSSEDATYLCMQNLSFSNKNTSVYQTEESTGINAAILTGFKKSKGEIIFPIPGHNMFNSEAISKILEFSNPNKIILGFRTNLRASRPPIKYLSSFILLNFYKLIINRKIIDIHGLNSYPSFLIEKTRKYKLGHGFHMIPITLGLALNCVILQIPIAVNPNHKSRTSKKFQDNWPSLKSIFAVIRQLSTSFGIKKNLISK
jgi:glycosyltransferase involved in cell wall biosynthesis